MIAQDLPIPDAEPGDVANRADEILSRPEFRDTESILDRAGRWLNDVLDDVFSTLSDGGVGSLVGWVFLGLTAAAVVWLLSRLTAMPGRARLARAQVVVDSTRVSAADHLTPAEWRAEAEHLAESGLFDEAVRARYRAVLADLIVAGLLEDIPGRTPGEYRIELATAAPPVAGDFDDLTTLFESVWYGPDDAEPSDLRRFSHSEDAVLAAVLS